MGQHNNNKGSPFLILKDLLLQNEKKQIPIKNNKNDPIIRDFSVF